MARIFLKAVFPLRSSIGRFGAVAAVVLAIAGCGGGGGTTSAVPISNGGPPGVGVIGVGVTGATPTPSPSPTAVPLTTPPPSTTPSPTPSPVPGPGTTPFPMGTSVPMAFGPSSSLTFPGGGAGYSFRADFGAAVPAGETLFYGGGQPLGWFMTNTFIDGVVFRVGPAAVPVSAITGITQTLGQAGSAGTNYTAGVTDIVGGIRTTLPVAIAPSTAFQTGPASQTAPLTTLVPNTTYFIFVGTY